MTQPHPLEQHAQRIAKQLAKDANPLFGEDLRHLLEENPVWVMDSLKGLLDAEKNEASTPHRLVDAYSLLLGRQLEFIRYGVDRGREDAIELARQFQLRVVGLARNGHISALLLNRIAVLLRDAKLQPITELFEVASNLMQDITPPADFDVAQIPAFLMDLASEANHDPFEIARGLTEFTYAMPPDALAMLAGLILSEPSLKLEESAALMLLDDRAEARRLIAQVLQSHAKQLSPVSLRRLIALRNWLPEEERKSLDEIVKTARRAGVVCAAWPEPNGVEVFASVVDGSGAQGFFFLTKSGRKHQIASLLLRLGKGILDAWTLPDLPKKQRDTILAEVADQMPLIAVSRSYADLAVQHHLAAGSTGDALPPVAALQVAELIGAASWLPQRLDLEAAIEQVLPEVPPELMEPGAIVEILESSADWAGQTGITHSWFEDDQSVEHLLSGTRAKKRDTLVTKVLNDILEPRARQWAERCLWAALWCREASPDLRMFWPYFLIVAKAITEKYPLKQISLMTEVAEETLEAALHRQ